MSAHDVSGFSVVVPSVLASAVAATSAAVSVASAVASAAGDAERCPTIGSKFPSHAGEHSADDDSPYDVSLLSF